METIYPTINDSRLKWRGNMTFIFSEPLVEFQAARL